VAARVEKAAVVMLAVDLDREPGNIAEVPAGTGAEPTNARLPPSLLTVRRRSSGSPGSVSMP
jgi:hypothetical protein